MHAIESRENALKEIWAVEGANEQLMNEIKDILTAHGTFEEETQSVEASLIRDGNSRETTAMKTKFCRWSVTSTS
jgi:hypothetical protein